MSTLKVATIQDTSGNNSSTPEQVAQGRAKAWVLFNGKNTVAIRDSFNVTSLTDNGTGDYTITFTTAMSSANYAVAGNWDEGNATAVQENFATTSIGYQTKYTGTLFADYAYVSVIVFGD